MVVPAEKDLWRDSMTLTFRNASGPLTAWLNGTKIIESGPLVAGKSGRFKVPKGILEKSVFNTLVVRLEGGEATHGLTDAPIVAGYFDELSLGPAWQATAVEPTPEELKPLSEPPPTAFYTEKNFHLATTPMQAASELIRGKFVSPADALSALKTTDDLVVEEMLHEPEIAQPTQVSFDERGRAWVSQYRQYPYPAGLKMTGRDQFYRSKYDRVPPAPPHHDHGADIISVHEDTDGDGRYDLHKNVLTGLNMANAAVHGHGGFWVMETPYLLFYPDADGDDVPDRDPEVRLSGFGLEDTHSVANGLIWGPDGWLYGAQGSTTTSRVVRPGIDPENSPGIYVEGCMVWRYHPEKKIYEIFADGSGNTFGLSFDAEGRLYSGHNGGDTRGWHHIQEGLFLKQGKDAGKFGPVPNYFTFGELPAMKSTHPVARFSHMLCVVEGSAMPERWLGKLFSIDPLHHYVVASERKPLGSTFITTDVGFPLKTEDETFRPVFITNAPDGSVFIADFREEYIAHGQNYQSQIDPDTGRLYRLRGKDQRLEKDVNLAIKTSAQLVAVLSHPNVWHRQTAVRLLAERHDREVVASLQQLLKAPALHPALEGLWALNAYDDSGLLDALTHPAPMVRAWAIRLAGDARNLPEPFAKQVLAMAATESDPEVRSQIISTARRLPVGQALPLVFAIARRGVDGDDTYIPLMTWFVIESHCQSNVAAILAPLDDPSLWAAPFVRQHLVPKLMRRFAEAGTRQDLVVCATLLNKAPTKEDQQSLLAGFDEAFKGRALPSLPDELVKALTDSGLASTSLKLRQGDPAAVEAALKLLADEAGDPVMKLEAIHAFGERPRPEALPGLVNLAMNQSRYEVQKAALGALSSYDDPVVASGLTLNWIALPKELQPVVLSLLVSRPAWSRVVLLAVEAALIKKEDFSEDIITRLRGHDDKELSAKIDALFPKTKPVARESFKPRIDAIRTILTNAPGDAYKGEPLFMNRCGACHTLFFKGGKIGPNLTTYQRDDLGTMLISIVDPNAEVREGFAYYLITTKDGRSLSGFLADRDANTVVLRGLDGIDLSLAQKDIAEMKPAGRSLMPEGILDGLSEDELRHLFAYLRQSQPISK